MIPAMQAPQVYTRTATQQCMRYSTSVRLVRTVYVVSQLAPCRHTHTKLPCFRISTSSSAAYALAGGWWIVSSTVACVTCAMV